MNKSNHMNGNGKPATNGVAHKPHSGSQWGASPLQMAPMPPIQSPPTMAPMGDPASMAELSKAVTSFMQLFGSGAGAAAPLPGSPGPMPSNPGAMPNAASPNAASPNAVPPMPTVPGVGGSPTTAMASANQAPVPGGAPSPVSMPTAPPSAIPATTPSAIPMATPSGLPTGTPSGIPSTPPMSIATGMSTTMPTSAPMGAPSASSMPAAQPSPAGSPVSGARVLQEACGVSQPLNASLRDQHSTGTPYYLMNR